MTTAQVVDSVSSMELDGVIISARRSEGITRMAGAENGLIMGRDELFRAACCNLGESFSTNASVDVSYSDATTGARQIRLLGLSGIYVQMLGENMPMLRGLAAPFALDYVPGAWMQSIAVSKGSASVRNGFESITGQIDVEYLKPDRESGASVNLYGNSMGRIEANLDANRRIGTKLSTELLAHYQDDYADHDGNHDGFLDLPKVRQLNLQNRWKLTSGRYLMHAGIGYIDEEREGGQTPHILASLHDNGRGVSGLYSIGSASRRVDGYMKHAYIIDRDCGTNVALMANASLHDLHGVYGLKNYDATQRSLYAQMIFEHTIGYDHSIAAGLSLQHDAIDQSLSGMADVVDYERETVPGIYAQYTYNAANRIVAMAGLRVDHSTLYGTFVTPRLHVKWMAADWLTVRLSSGRGYRTPHALAENHYLLASGRTLAVDYLQQEAAWNTGISSTWLIAIGEEMLKVNAEYYYTAFDQQMVIDYDSDPHAIRVTNLDGRSRSHTVQVDATYPIVEGLEATVAYRLNDVRTTYGTRYMQRPLASRHKGFVALSYKTPLELWQVDVTMQLCGGGRMPTPYKLDDGALSWAERYKAYPQLSAQVTRHFRHFSVYAGGENLTNYRQPDSIINAGDPWSTSFEPTMLWGPLQGIMLYAGVRAHLLRD